MRGGERVDDLPRYHQRALLRKRALKLESPRETLALDLLKHEKEAAVDESPEVGCLGNVRMIDEARCDCLSLEASNDL